MDKNKGFYCPWADRGLALHNSGAALVCCHSRTFLKDSDGNQIFMHTHSLENAWNSPTRKEIQSALESGKQHPNCNACWDDENTGGMSRRIAHNNLDMDYSDTVDAPLLLDLKLGNVCNLSCRTCNPWVSSQWVKDWWLTFDRYHQNNTYSNFEDYSREKFRSWRLSYNDDNVQFWDKLHDWLPHAKYIDIYGAEPMLIHKLFDILSYSIEQNHHKHQTLHFNTNCTIWNQKYIDILTQFKQVFFDLSIDGIYGHYDYIRNGETWDVVSDNIQRYENLNRSFPQHSVSICITVSIFNIYYLDEIYQYFESRGWHMHFNMAHLPQHVNIKIIPEPVKQKIKEKLLSSPSENFKREFNQILGYLNETLVPNEVDYKKPLWEEFETITNELDSIRKQKFSTTFPEFYNLLSEYWSKE